jgi:hypothetical protein
MVTKVKRPKRTEQVSEPQAIDTNRWQVGSAGSDEIYDVRLWSWGWDCTCADHSYRHMRNGGLCKHAAATWAALLDQEEASMQSS